MGPICQTSIGSWQLNVLRSIAINNQAQVNSLEPPAQMTIPRPEHFPIGTGSAFAASLNRAASSNVASVLTTMSQPAADHIHRSTIASLGIAYKAVNVNSGCSLGFGARVRK